jgi:hypothetical protein
MLTTLVWIAVLHWLILVTPGANVLVVSQLAAGGDRRAACFAAIGITVVALIWASLAALGVHAVLPRTLICDPLSSSPAERTSAISLSVSGARLHAQTCPATGACLLAPPSGSGSSRTS